ncbi:CLUMA_CG013015, isoform A [Clunio marinus]|uniref:CLUMA_CG013015, isoform A n=1 Tax=Clunio marinus TaxID=568069 RepID=A0A1J1IKY8_9DIPT|nr:CLUMA_CG013015, isoform A [Clunio marinus]
MKCLVNNIMQIQIPQLWQFIKNCIRQVTSHTNMGLLRFRNLITFTLLAVILLPKIRADVL